MQVPQNLKKCQGKGGSCPNLATVHTRYPKYPGEEYDLCPACYEWEIEEDGKAVQPYKFGAQVEILQ